MGWESAAQQSIGEDILLILIEDGLLIRDHICGIDHFRIYDIPGQECDRISTLLLAAAVLALVDGMCWKLLMQTLLVV